MPEQHCNTDSTYTAETARARLTELISRNHGQFATCEEAQEIALLVAYLADEAAFGGTA